MFKFAIKDCYEGKILTKVIDRFKLNEVPKYRELEKYYRVRNKILSRTMDSNKPNNKLAHGFARYISNMATSYFIGKPIKYETEDEEYKELLSKELKNNYIHKINYDVSKEASKKGIGFYLLFLDEGGNIRIKKYDAEEIIPIYSPNLGEFLEGCIRIWEECDIDGVLIAEYAALYDKENITTYKRTSSAGTYQAVDIERHMFADIPVIVVQNNEEMAGDFETVIPLINAYDKAQSDTGNDMEYFSDAYLCIVGANELVEGGGIGEGEEENKKAADLRKDKLLYLDEKGQAYWLTKNVNDASSENYKDRIYKDIFFLSQVPALSDESFAGNLTGVAIKYKLIGLEELAIMKQNSFEAAQKKLVKLVTEYINLRYNKNFDPEIVQQKYERNFIANEAEMITNARNLENIVSRDTQLQMLPANIVPDSRKELEKIQKEMMESEHLPCVDEI